MSIFYSIVKILSSENSDITSIISFPFFFVDAYIFMLLFSTLLNIKANYKQKILYVVLLSISCFFFRTFIPNPYGIIINMIIWPIYVFFIFRTTIAKAILAELIPYSITIVLEIFLEKLFFTITNLPASSLLNIPIYRISIATLTYTIVYLFYRLIKKFKFSITQLELINAKSRKIIAINCILALITIFIQFYLLNYYSSNFPLIISLLNILGLVIYFIITIVSFVHITKLDFTSMSLEESQLSYKTLELLYDNTRAFKHDFGNILDGFGIFADTNDLDGFKKYYHQLLEDYRRVNNLATLSPEIINNRSIYILLASKYHRADQLGITINLEVFLDLNELNMKLYEFARILGILMDNAIEATNECQEKIINISFRKNDKKRIQLITIKNTFKNKNIDLNKIYEKNYSTKEKNTGIGLWEVKKITKSNNNVKLITEKDENFFSQKLQIYY